jgi:hypothetical protein
MLEDFLPLAVGAAVLTYGFVRCAAWLRWRLRKQPPSTLNDAARKQAADLLEDSIRTLLITSKFCPDMGAARRVVFGYGGKTFVMTLQVADADADADADKPNS